MAYAPAAIRAAGNRIVAAIPGAVFSGIVGDASHSYGYHLARNQLPGSDYSVTLPRDRGGNGDAASALDISLPPDQMIAVTSRLDAAAKAGVAGLSALREFAGTFNGRDTYAYDLSNGRPSFDTWDDSHLWHVHLSGYRESADDFAAWDAIASVFIGGNQSGSAVAGTPIAGADLGGAIQEEEDMTPEEHASLVDAQANANSANAQSGQALTELRQARTVMDDTQVKANAAYVQAAQVLAELRAFIAVSGAASGGTTDSAMLQKVAQQAAEEALRGLGVALAK